MTIVDDRYIVSDSLSEAWLEAVYALDRIKGKKAVHLIVRISRPTAEVEAIREGAEWLIDVRNAKLAEDKELPAIETTRNTIFPAVWARRHPDPADLSSYYRERYTREGLRAFGENERGTYFGRIVSYPRAGGEDNGDQLVDTIRKLRDELAPPSRNKPRGGSKKSSRYEINIYSELCDTSPMGFPCLAHLSVHMHEGAVHVQAIYRNELLVARAYGNYLGLAELQAYIAEQCGLELGELTITVGHVELEATRAQVKELRKRVEATQT